MTKKFLLSLPNELHEDVKFMAKIEDKTLQDFIEDNLQELVDSYKNGNWANSEWLRDVMKDKDKKK